MDKKEIEIKINHWETNKPNRGRVSVTHNKISRKQLERIMAIIHETEKPNEQ